MDITFICFIFVEHLKLIIMDKIFSKRKPITKKAFKELCYNAQYGTGLNKRNAIYYDHNENGYKYMVKCCVRYFNASELYSILYLWVTTGEKPEFDKLLIIQTRFAETDEQRFKVSIAG